MRQELEQVKRQLQEKNQRVKDLEWELENQRRWALMSLIPHDTIDRATTTMSIDPIPFRRCRVWTLSSTRHGVSQAMAKELFDVW